MRGKIAKGRARAKSAQRSRDSRAAAGKNETVAQTYSAYRSRARVAIFTLSDEPGVFWLEGCLLARDRRRDRLLVAFTDMDLDEPAWLPAAAVRCEPYEGGEVGWGCFRLAAALAAQRAQLSARVLAAKPERKPAVRRPKVFRPKGRNSVHAAQRGQMELF